MKVLCDQKEVEQPDEEDSNEKQENETSRLFCLTLSLEEIHGERGFGKPAELHVVEVDIERLLFAVTTAFPTSPNPSTSKRSSSNLNIPAMKLFENCCSELL